VDNAGQLTLADGIKRETATKQQKLVSSIYFTQGSRIAEISVTDMKVVRVNPAISFKKLSFIRMEILVRNTRV